ncbi:MAG TPA: DUF3800 domain-containing protein [Candidatus Paceibacterota bacterium]
MPNLNENSLAGQPKTLYLFIDESGNFDFSPKGTKYWVLTSVSTFSPKVNYASVMDLKYHFLNNGIDVAFFHASEDAANRRGVLARTFHTISQMNGLDVDAVVVQKNKVNPALYEEIKAYQKGKGLKFIRTPVEDQFYRKICRTLLQYVFRRHHDKIERVIIVLGKVFTNKQREFIKVELRDYLAEKFPLLPFSIYFHPVEADFNSQIADYCGWAVFVNNERNTMRDFERQCYDLLKPKLKSEFRIFDIGGTTYYQHENKKERGQGPAP